MRLRSFKVQSTLSKFVSENGHILFNYPTDENGKERCISAFLGFFFVVFHAKSGTTNKHRSRSFGISY